MKNRTMTAAVFERAGTLAIKEVPIPQIKNPDEVLIRVEAVSLCGTDVRGLADPPEFLFREGVVIGHECCGTVEEVGSSVTTFKAGDRVVVHPNQWCGKCYYCKTGQINLCENFLHVGDSRDGAMADYLCVPEKLVYSISKDVVPYVACLAEPLACVLNATKSFRIHPGENAVVLGAGPIGMIFVMLYKAAGATVIISDVSEKRRQAAMDIGADYAIDPATQDLESEVKKVMSRGADIVVDAVGMLMGDAVKLAQKGGHVIIFGINTRANATVAPAPVVINEVNIHGRFITKGTMPLAVQIIEKKLIPIEKLITHRLPIQDTAKGIELMRSGEGVKVIIEIAK